jgi:hypothetical protein
MSQLVKTKRQANFKGFKRFGAFKGLVEQTSVLKAHECQKRPNLHTNSSNKLLLHNHIPIFDNYHIQIFSEIQISPLLLLFCFYNYLRCNTFVGTLYKNTKFK